MELQLCLSLVPTTTINNNNNNNNLPIVGIDLNHSFKEGNNNNNICDLVSQEYDHNYKFGSNTNKAKILKRRFCQAFSEIGSSSRRRSKTLPLLWCNSPSDNDYDNDDQDREKNFFPSLVKNNVDEEAGVVGWPPIKPWTKRLCCDFAGRSDGNRTVENICRCGERISKFMYVKVKMEGVGIARKVDLSLHSCFKTLINTLLNMFVFEDEDYYSLIYQDRKGNWFHTKDVSWRIFLRTVQRLKLVKRDREWNH